MFDLIYYAVSLYENVIIPGQSHAQLLSACLPGPVGIQGKQVKKVIQGSKGEPVKNNK